MNIYNKLFNIPTYVLVFYMIITFHFTIFMKHQKYHYYTMYNNII